MSATPNQDGLFDAHFDGKTYDPKHDKDRLKKQIGRVFGVTYQDRWWTLEQIASMTGDPQASISAQLRHLRKPKFGGYDVQRRPRGERSRGLYEYRVLDAK